MKILNSENWDFEVINGTEITYKVEKNATPAIVFVNDLTYIFIKG